MNVGQELAVFEQMASELEEYLLSQVLLWQMQGRSSFPRLSLGLMLLTRTRLRAAEAQLSPAQRAERDRLDQQVEASLSRWQVASENKAAKELHMRLNLWQRFWDECREDGRQCAERYAQEVTQRTIAGLLLRELPRLKEAPEARPLDPLDRLIRPRLRRDGFVWEAEIQPGFPEAEFWYLYGKPA